MRHVLRALLALSLAGTAGAPAAVLDLVGLPSAPRHHAQRFVLECGAGTNPNGCP